MARAATKRKSYQRMPTRERMLANDRRMGDGLRLCESLKLRRGWKSMWQSQEHFRALAQSGSLHFDFLDSRR